MNNNTSNTQDSNLYQNADMFTLEEIFDSIHCEQQALEDEQLYIELQGAAISEHASDCVVCDVANIARLYPECP